MEKLFRSIDTCHINDSPRIMGTDDSVLAAATAGDIDLWYCCGDTRFCKHILHLTIVTNVFLILKKIFIAFIGTCGPLYCISTTADHIILKACISLNAIEKQYKC